MHLVQPALRQLPLATSILTKVLETAMNTTIQFFPGHHAVHASRVVFGSVSERAAHPDVTWLDYPQDPTRNRALIRRAGAAYPTGRFPMMKYRGACLSRTVAALISGVGAQNSQVRSSSARSSADLHAATQPLTPKSALPAKRKSSSAVPSASKRGGNTTAELTHLERQDIRARGSNSGLRGRTLIPRIRRNRGSLRTIRRSCR
jgi:hypothetical protein